MAASFILIMFREDGKGLHDMIAGTIVVFEDKVSEESKVKEAKIVKTSKKSKDKKEDK